MKLVPKMPKTNKQKEKIQKAISDKEAAKKTLVRNKSKYNPMKFHQELNKLNREIENLEKKL